LSGIRVRLLLLVGLAIVPLFIFTIFQGIAERRRAAARQRIDAHRLAQLFAAEHHRIVTDGRRMLYILAQAPAVRRGDPSECGQLFRDVLSEWTQYSNLMLAHAQAGITAAAFPAALTEDEHALMLRAADSTFAVGPLRRVGSTQFPTLGFAHAVSGDGTGTPAILLARAGVQWIAEEFEVASADHLTRVTIWDGSGRVLLRYPDPEGYLGRDASGSAVWRVMRDKRGEGTAEAAGADGIPRLYGFTRLRYAGNGPMFLSVGIPSDVAFKELRHLERRNVLLLALVTALAAAVALMGGERLVRVFGGMQRMAERDALTGLANRRRLTTVGQDEERRARRLGHPLAALMLDLDRFKLVNDRYGHGAGDDVLREVARRIQSTVREIDLAARYGGEEFAVLLPDTRIEKAREVAERIREVVGGSPVETRSGPLPVTISAGVAVLDGEAGDLTSLFEAADGALYAAKEAGRNRVSVADRPLAPLPRRAPAATGRGGGSPPAAG
jgi:diguanylate cyclase (GGDEF)-like protein